MKLRDYVTGRVVAWAIIALLGAWFGIGRADAHPGAHDSLGEAYSHCMTDAAALNASLGPPMATGYQCDGPTERGSLEMQFVCKIIWGGSPTTCGNLGAPGSNYWAPRCPSGTEWNQVTGKCDEPCSTKPPLDGGVHRGTVSSSCHEGCAYAGSSSNITNVVGSDGVPVIWTLSKGWEPTGARCGVGEEDALNEVDCKPLGAGQTACKRDDGQICSTATANKAICWRPGETGEKSDGPVLQKTNAGEVVIAPNAALPNGDTLNGVPGQSMTTTIIIGGTTIITTTTNYSTANGTDVGGQTPGQSEGGQEGGNGGEDDGEELDDDGNLPPGGGGGGGGGGGDGGGEGDGEDDGPGGVGNGVGELYEGTGKTVDSVFTAYKTRIMAAPILSAGANFLTVSVSASCPVFTLEASAYWDVMTFNHHCQGPLADSLSLGGWLVLAIAAFAAFRVALY